IKLSDKVRWKLYAFAGMDIKERCTVWGPITLRPIGSAGNVSIGAGTFINSDIRFGAKGKISIGSKVAIGPRVCFETVNHGLKNMGGRTTESLPIIVHDGAWIGAGAIILPGVSVGRNAVVAAGAVVTRDVPEFALVGGCPARLIR